MAIIDGWISWAQRVDGHPEKQYTARNSMQGIALHSIVGQESEAADGIPNRFLADTRPNGEGRFSSAEAASCTFVLRKNGILIQMYPVNTSAWTSGGEVANTSFIPIELEGGGPGNEREPMTPVQQMVFAKWVLELEAYTGQTYNYGVNMLQHKDIARKYGYNATSCASDRYDLGIAALQTARLSGVKEVVFTSKDKANLDSLMTEVAELKAKQERFNTVTVARYAALRAALNPELAEAVSALEIATAILKKEI